MCLRVNQPEPRLELLRQMSRAHWRAAKKRCGAVVVILAVEPRCLVLIFLLNNHRVPGESQPSVLHLSASKRVMTVLSVSCSCCKELLINRIHYLLGTSCVGLFEIGFHREFCRDAGCQERGTAFLRAGE